MNNIDGLKEILQSPKKILISTHRNPDGDAIGSSLGLQHYLEKMGHEVVVTTPSEYPESFNWLPKVNDIIVDDLEPEKLQSITAEAEVIFSLDYNALHRVDNTGKYIMKNKSATKVLIDHHLEPEDFANFTMSDTSSSSTCELVYDFIGLISSHDDIDINIGSCLFTGILTDTGSFKHATSPKLYRVVADLVERGVPDHEIQGLTFNCLTETSLRLWGHAIFNKLEIVPETKTGIITLSKEDFETYDIQRGDTEGIVNSILRIKDIQVAALLTNQKKLVKLSLRSKGEFSVQEVASKFFNGGGHRNASGGMSSIGLEDTVRKFKKVMVHFKDKLPKTV